MEEDCKHIYDSIRNSSQPNDSNFGRLASSAQSTSSSNASNLYSRNCQNFNRLFHSSFDDESNSLTSQTEVGLDLSIVKTEVSLEPSEVQLEIEIETTEEKFDVDIKEDLIVKNECCPDVKLETGTTINQISTKSESTDLKLGSFEDKDEDEDQLLLEAIKLESDGFGDIQTGQRKSKRLPQFTTSEKTQEAQIMRQITAILKKKPEAINEDEHCLMEAFPTLVRIVKKRFEARVLSNERLKEFEDSKEVLADKCNHLADIIAKAKYLVVYSGAGISTSANIPDYRGTSGVWTLYKNGQSLDSQSLDTEIITSADPTLTHMALFKLYSDGIIKHIVSQNCDGLHLRSGIPKMGLSEIHGNMYVEVCVKCGRDYVRTFDVAENTRRHQHKTGRRCYNCSCPLKDSIVHFGERGNLRWPINWAGAEYNAHRADVILCIGSSLKVLRRYPWLWQMDKPACKRPKLVIINLMWTPKDQFAVLKIHGKCDDVMGKVMEKLSLQIPSYTRRDDPIFKIATPLHLNETKTRSSRQLIFPENEPFPIKLVDINNYIQFEPIFRSKSMLVMSDEESEPDDSIASSSTVGVRTRSSSSSRTKTTKKRKVCKRLIKKGNGKGWLGNLAPGVKMKKRKLK